MKASAIDESCVQSPTPRVCLARPGRGRTAPPSARAVLAFAHGLPGRCRSVRSEGIARLVSACERGRPALGWPQTAVSARVALRSRRRVWSAWLVELRLRQAQAGRRTKPIRLSESRNRCTLGSAHQSVRAPCHICTGTGLAPLPHLHRDWVHPCHICTGTVLALPHLHQDRARPCHICTGTVLAFATSGSGPLARNTRLGASDL